MTQAVLSGLQGRPINVHTGLFINNQFVPATNNHILETTNPANSRKLTDISAAQKEDVDRAVEASEAAFREWKTTPPQTRVRLLSKLADLIERDSIELASLEAIDAGILYGESLHLSVPQAVDTLRYFAGWADKGAGQSLPIPNGLAYTQHEPLGVCAAIVPWNAPLMITIWKLAPAIATGNVLIIKTPELTPLYGQKLAALILEARFPPGVINILCGEGKVAGQAIAEHPKIRKVAFTGSTLVGRQILRAAAETNLKRVTLELGGKGPSIVFPDADLENALFWTTLGITANNGQICAAGSRIYVHASIYERFLEEFKGRVAKAVHGDPLFATTSKGPLASAGQHQKVLGYINRAKEVGSRLLCGGEDLNGNFISNTAFADVKEDDTIMKEEIFGPVAAIARFETEAEVIAKANNSEYGLSAAIFTDNVSRAHRVAAAIETGQVTVNCWGNLHSNTPFGGMKQSGFGRDLGKEALDGWTSTKTVKVHLLSTGAKL
ncbi:putative aldehyde dehydrogenase [Aspergillus chevalieri]|uniref:aldehyde dehydrogenase (NAD(+)) n=1 Tax=Aspergillus chevalieri TaxID=182096 RepID=A0A7R7VED3_ASPCH|nr:uncharacterized protein ACHE_10649A [Aspergillus chevalieri]BCR83247.1 hypothetical protein ACHE_10649A [Aspergillus chevalieri]